MWSLLFSCVFVCVCVWCGTSVVFFDWDDTLLPSSFLSAEGYRLDSPFNETHKKVWTPLKELEKTVISVLSLAMKSAKVFIVTNAENGWVQLSSQVRPSGAVLRCAVVW